MAVRASLSLGCPVIPRWLEPLVWTPTLQSLNVSNAKFTDTQWRLQYQSRDEPHNR